MDLILDRYKSNMALIRHDSGDWNNTGDYIEGTEQQINFTGACLPLSDNDFSKNANGGYTTDDRKIYTSTQLNVGEKVIWNSNTYLVDKEKGYETIDNNFKRYFVKKVGAVSD